MSASASLAGGIYGMSLANTIWSATHKPKQSSGTTTYDFDTLTNQVSTDAMIPVIYGTRKWAGNTTWHNSSSDNSALTKDLVLCEGEIDGISDVRANDLPIGGSTGISVKNTTYQNAFVEEGGGVGGSPNNIYLILGNGNGTTYRITLNDYSTFQGLCNYINTIGDGWEATTSSPSSNPMNIAISDFFTKKPCYNSYASFYTSPLTDCSYTFSNGSPAQTPPSNYSTVGGYKNCAWMRVNLKSSDKLQGGNPTVTAIVRGKKVLDTRTGVTAYSENPAMCVRDYLLNKRYGLGRWITADMLDEDSIKECADACDTSVSYYVPSTLDTYDKVQNQITALQQQLALHPEYSQSVQDSINDSIESLQQSLITIQTQPVSEILDIGPRYTLNIILADQQSHIDNLQAILATFGGFLVFNGDKISLRMERQEEIRYSFDDSNIIATDGKPDIKFETTSLTDTPNQYNITFYDPNNNWTGVKVQVNDKADQKLRQRIIPKSVTLNGVTNQSQALRLGRIFMACNRLNALIVTFKTGTMALHLQPGDVIALTHKELNGMPFRITQTTESKGTWTLKCQQYNASIYDDRLGMQITQKNYCSIPNPFTDTVPEVFGIITSQTYYRQKDGTIISDLIINWNSPNYPFVTQYNISYSIDNGVSWYDVGQTTGTSFALHNTLVGKNYLVKIVTQNSAQRRSEGIISESVLIIGKDEPPSNITGLTVTIDNNKINILWDKCTDVDFNRYSIRYGNGWDNGTVISDSVFDNKYIFIPTASGIYNIMVKAVDNSGGYSSTAESFSVDVVLEPSAVSSFSGQIVETDRSQIVLTWDTNTEKNISHYELRIGEDWDTATIIAGQLKATQFIYRMSQEGYTTFLIKAVNNEGFYSREAASYSLQITLRPDAPQNLNAQQKPQDRSVMLITWDASPGKDIAGYEIRYGNGWDTGTYIDFTTNTFYEWDIPNSGMYNIMVKAKTVAGYYSNVSNVSIQTFIEAYDVTGFTGAQSVIDRATVHLMWDNPLSHDVAYFEIRRGGSWDSGVVVADRVTNNYVDVTIPDEGQQTWWIKAVTVGGKYSLYPASFGAEWDLNPSPVTNISLTQDINDKSVINISFTGITEIDLLYYEIRYGWTWQDSALLVQTTNTSYQFRPDATSGNVKVLIKAVNKAQYYSDEASKSLYATLEPQDVQNFIVQQNGEYVELYWDRAYENDVVGYEIREGWTFEYGQLIATNVTGNSYSYKVDFDGPYHYWIKAINRSNKYSVNAVDQELNVVDLPPKNVIQSFDEMALHSGTHTNTEFGTSLINWQTIGGQWSDYPDLKFEDVGGSNVLKLKIQEDSTYPATGVYECEQIDVGRVVTANISVKFLSTVKYQGETSAILQMRVSKDGTEWSVWKDFLPAKFVFRYIELRVNMTTTDPLKTPEVNTFNVMVDLPDIEKAGTVEVPVGGIRITYDTDFYIVPVVTPYAIGSGVRVEITDRDKTGFYARILDLSGADVGGTMDWRARGY